MTGEVHFHVDISDADHELDRLMNGPGSKAIIGFESVLAESFAETQMVVHIITGSLKASAKIDSEYRTGQWSGEISYGGASPGSVFDPVKYAVFEYAKGGEHDFIRPAFENDSRYGDVIDDFMEGI